MNFTERYGALPTTFVAALTAGTSSYSAHLEISGTCEKLKEDIPRKYDVFSHKSSENPEKSAFSKIRKKARFGRCDGRYKTTINLVDMNL